MTRVPLAAPQAEGMRWPTDITIAERSALVTALAPRQLCAPLRAARRQLRRFLAPLEDAAVSLGLPESARQKVQRSVLLRMLDGDTPWDAGTRRPGLRSLTPRVFTEPMCWPLPRDWVRSLVTTLSAHVVSRRI